MIRANQRLELTVLLESWPMARPLTISGYTFSSLPTVLVQLGDGVHAGRGEAAGIFYFRETPASMVAQIESVRERIQSGVSREELRTLLPPGGARNALDCAMWDLEAQQSGKPVWQLAGLREPRPLLTTYTIGGETPVAVADIARTRYREARAIKLKLLGDGHDADRVRAAREARPDVWLGVDANQGLTPTTFKELMPALVAARVELVEQPFARGEEHRLEALESPVPLAADESVQSLREVASAVGRFNVVNIKLDKCGGLTEALLMVREAQTAGLRIMVGNMGGTALAMAPAMLVGQFCDIVDLDGPLFLAHEREPAVIYEHGCIVPPFSSWGTPRGPRRGAES